MVKIVLHIYKVFPQMFSLYLLVLLKKRPLSLDDT